jgi:syntaxin 7
VKELSEQAAEPGAPASAKATQMKLVKDFQAVLKEFQKTQRTCAERETNFLPQADAGRPLVAAGSRAAAAGLPSYVETEGSYQRSESLEQQALLKESKRQELLQLDGEIDYNNALIAERDAGIAEIQSQIGEVNEIFQDLAVLVNEQGGMIDDIEANIVRTSVRTKEARKELVSAETNQKSARRSLIILVVIIFVVIIGAHPALVARISGSASLAFLTRRAAAIVIALKSSL